MPGALMFPYSRMSGGGLGFSGGLGGGGMALALRSGAGAGYGMGGGLGMGMGGGLGMGMGGGLGMGMGAGMGGGLGMGLGMGGGGGGAGALMGHAAGGMGAGGAAAAAAVAAAAALAPVLTRAAEKQTLSGLNQRFASYIAKVRQLQQENATLEAKLIQLTGGADMSPETSGTTTTVDYEGQLAEYRGKLQTLTLETVKLEIELDGVRGTAHELKAKYDFEQGVKFQLEADIAAMKRDVDVASDLRIELEAKHSSVKEDLDFITKTQDEELFSLQSKLGTSTADTSVSMIEVDTGKSFDIVDALNKMRAEYEKSVQQTRDEADAYYKLKMEEVQAASASSAEAVSTAKAELTTSKKELQSLSLELQSLINLNLTLEGGLAEAQAMSTGGVAEYQAQIASLEGAIETAKTDLHKQILMYQELLDIKLALDAEISTYRTLLDGDDISFPLDTSSLLSSPGPSQGNSTETNAKPEDKESANLDDSYAEEATESKEGTIEAPSESTTDVTSDAESES